MSETIHSSMNGHKLFAEIIAETISGRRVSLADVPPPADGLHFTLQRLRAGQPVQVLAMPPYDKLVPEALCKLFPRARIDVIVWPTAGRSLAQLEQWAKSIRPKPPHLVVIAVPAAVQAEDDEPFLRSYAWVLNYSIAFDKLAWDRLVVLPAVTGPIQPGQQHWADLARQLTRGSDSAFVDRRDVDDRPAALLIQDFVRDSSAAGAPGK